MGKYQLDDKGKAQVQRFHEKHSKGGINKKDRVASLREQFLKKAKKAGLEPAAASLLYQRGVQTEEALQEFLEPSLDQLHDPYDLHDMDRAVERIRTDRKSVV